MQDFRSCRPIEEAPEGINLSTNKTNALAPKTPSKEITTGPPRFNAGRPDSFKPRHRPHDSLQTEPSPVTLSGSPGGHQENITFGALPHHANRRLL
jgi:hypothetical protein